MRRARRLEERNLLSGQYDQSVRSRRRGRRDQTYDGGYMTPKDAKKMEDQIENQRDAERFSGIAKNLSGVTEALYCSDFNNKGGHSISEEKEIEKEREGLAYFKKIIKSSGHFSITRDRFVGPDEDKDDSQVVKIESRLSEVPTSTIDAEHVDVHDLGQLMDHLDHFYAEKDPLINAFTSVWKTVNRTQNIGALTIKFPGKTLTETTIKIPNIYKNTKNATIAGMAFARAATAPVIEGMEKTIKAQKNIINRVKYERDNFVANIQKAFDGARSRVIHIERELQDVSRRLLDCERGIASKQDPEVIRRNMQESQEQIDDVRDATQDMRQTLDRIEVQTAQDSEEIQSNIASAEQEALMAMDGTVEEGADNASEMADQADDIADQAENVYNSMKPPPLPPRDEEPSSSSLEANANAQSANGVADAMNQEGNALVSALERIRARVATSSEDPDNRGPTRDSEWDLPEYGNNGRRLTRPLYEKILRSPKPIGSDIMSPENVKSWRTNEVVLWLKLKGFSKNVQEIFKEEEIEGRGLLIISPSDLVDMGITDREQISEIIDAIEKLEKLSKAKKSIPLAISAASKNGKRREEDDDAPTISADETEFEDTKNISSKLDSCDKEEECAENEEFSEKKIPVMKDMVSAKTISAATEVNENDYW